jgi:hypothetical protein
MPVSRRIDTADSTMDSTADSTAGTRSTAAV